MFGNQVHNGKHILVVEDHDESAELLRMVLEIAGHHVQSVATGRRAIQTLASEDEHEDSKYKPDLILLDLRLPDMHGTEVVRELRKNLPEAPPVVFLSADPPQALKEAANSVGATAVRKPFDFDELFRAIDDALAKTAAS